MARSNLMNVDSADPAYQKLKKTSPTYADIAVGPNDLKPMLPNIRGATYPQPQSPPPNPLAGLNTLLATDPAYLALRQRASAPSRVETSEAPAARVAPPSAAAPPQAPSNPYSQADVSGPPAPSQGYDLARDKIRASIAFDDSMRQKYLGQKYAQYTGMGMTPGAAAQMRTEMGAADDAAAWRHQIQLGSDRTLSGARGEAAASEYQRFSDARGAEDAMSTLRRNIALSGGEAQLAINQRAKRAATELPLQSPGEQLAGAEAQGKIEQVGRERESAARDEPYVAAAQDVERLKRANPQYGSVTQGLASNIGQLHGQYINTQEESGQYQALQSTWDDFMRLPNPLKPEAAREILSLLQSKGINAPIEDSRGSTVAARVIQDIPRGAMGILSGKGRAESESWTRAKDASIKAMFNNLRYFAGSGRAV